MDIPATVHSSQGGPESNKDGGGYKVVDAGTSRSNASIADRHAALHDEKKPLVIDDHFISEWHPKYDMTENDEDEYQRLVPTVARDMASTATISKSTFLRIWQW